MKSITQLAISAYHAYCKQAGGKTHDGQPLPAYTNLGADRQACWEAAARQMVAEIAAIH